MPTTPSLPKTPCSGTGCKTGDHQDGGTPVSGVAALSSLWTRKAGGNMWAWQEAHDEGPMHQCFDRGGKTVL